MDLVFYLQKGTLKISVLKRKLEIVFKIKTIHNTRSLESNPFLIKPTTLIYIYLL